mmetsp:Transcript_91455/g.261198  ORF Transcript_91455/g.261198 Transcript_91455/m.261198 type:complete len:518 (+) Transcript_91455:141-1694(+)
MRTAVLITALVALAPFATAESPSAATLGVSLRRLTGSWLDQYGGAPKATVIESPVVAGGGTYTAGEEVPEDPFVEEEDAEGAEGAEEHDEHWHKPLFPLNMSDYLGFGLSCLGLMIAAGGGIGGGGILVPLYVLVLNFTPKYAIPLSNVTVFGGACMNYAMNLSKRHPDADRPLVDWDLILVMEPLTILGAIIGSYLNKMLPELVLTILLVILLALTAKSTTEKGIKVYNKETKAKEAAAQKESELAKMSSEEAAEEAAAETEGLLAEEGGKKEISPELQKIYDEERVVPLFKVGVLWAVFVVVLAVNLLKGGGAFPSPLGIECGSPGFIFSTVFMFAWIVVVSIWCRNYLIQRHHLKERLGFEYVEGDIKWDETATIKYPLYCMVAGVFAGMFGIGGGIVKGPLMLAMGIHPKVSSASSACMIMYTSFTATTSFFVFGLLKMDYAVVCVIMGLALTFVGQLGLSAIIKALGRDSLIVFSIAGVVGLSAILMGFHSMIAIMTPGHEEPEANFCDAGE